MNASTAADFEHGQEVPTETSFEFEELICFLAEQSIGGQCEIDINILSRAERLLLTSLIEKGTVTMIPGIAGSKDVIVYTDEFHKLSSKFKAKRLRRLGIIMTTGLGLMAGALIYFIFLR